MISDDDINIVVPNVAVIASALLAKYGIGKFPAALSSDTSNDDAIEWPIYPSYVTVGNIFQTDTSARPEDQEFGRTLGPKQSGGECIRVTATGGNTNPQWLIDGPAFQVFIIGSTNMEPTTVVNRAYLANRVLNGITATDVYMRITNGEYDVVFDDESKTEEHKKIGHITAINQLSDVIYLGKDERNHHNASANFVMIFEAEPLDLQGIPENRKPLS